VVGEAIPTDVTSARLRRVAVTTREPAGLVYAITPFNRPLNQVANKLGPALAAGNRVLLKPSERTPLTAVRFVHTLLAAGLPADRLALVTGDPAEVGGAIVDSGLADVITFTGSSAVGRRVARAAGMCRVLMELGDSGALIVMDDADLEQAAAAAASGAFATSGQSCRGVKRILVHERVAEELVARLVRHAEQLRVGDPADPNTDIGTLIDEPAAVEVERRVVEAVSGGARVVSGGQRRGAQFAPTVLDRVSRGALLVREETFGPVAPVIRVTSLDDAIQCVNEVRYGLQAGIFTQRLDDVLRAGRELAVGTVIANGGPQFEAPNIPFGGVKDSGLGREGVRYAMQEMSTVKTLVL
jgi:acyl-CoA reductase-like NAD-dependent aldehyde dehydrogenase